MAAGRGSRMDRETRRKPKCLCEINGQTLLEMQLEGLYSEGIHDVSIVGGYRSEMLSGFKARHITNTAWESSSMLSSLHKAVIEGIEPPVLVIYGDVIFDESALGLILADPRDIVLGSVPRWRNNWESRYEDPRDDAESFRVDGMGELQEIGGKISDLEEVQGQFAGVFFVRDDGWIAMKRHERIFHSLSTTELLQLLLNDGVSIGVHTLGSYWFEIDTQRDLDFARQSLEVRLEEGEKS
ncbi:MAG: phosphocholine cytidylyltransferase family protein [Candidatus Nanopelagicales bacterium]|nr:phosphocholine cytidylyltransferase family protein [Candidatus Nanopelagicales bacterium]